MTIERCLRGIAGFFVLLSVLLAHYHSHYWLFFTGFVGLNLLQPAFTDFCPMINILRVPNKMNRSTESERFCVWQGRRSRPSDDG